MRGRFRRSGAGNGLLALLLCGAVLLFLASALFYLKTLSTQIALSDACDIVTAEVNDCIAELLREEQFSGDAFVQLEKNENGEVVAISSNMAQINALSSQLLERVIGATENRIITVEIPAGNLSGVSLLMGRGPMVPVRIAALSSSRVRFGNSIVTAGINQTKHQISLQVSVDIDVLIPWGTESARVDTEVLIADTVIVGQVPDTYVNMR